MSVDFKTFLQIVPHVLAVRKPVLIRGRHGIGKSEVVYQIGSKLSMPVIERRASQMTEGDLIGLPSIDGNSTRFNPPDWYRAACESAYILFLDEVDRATPEVRQGIFELTDSRKLNGHSLHPETLVFAAINGGDHAAQYQVGEMDPAELSRYTVFDLEPTVDDWLSWALDGGDIHPVIWDFINQNKGHLEHAGDFEPNKVYPCRRSWKRLNDCLSRAELLDGWSEKLFPLAAAFIGMEAGVAFQAHVKDYKFLVTVEDIIDHGRIELASKFGVNDHIAMVDKIEASGRLAVTLDLDKLTNLANYFVVCPSEAAVKLWSAITAVSEANTVTLHGIVVDGESVAHRFVNMCHVGEE